MVVGLGGEVLELENAMSVSDPDTKAGIQFRKREAADVGNYAMFSAYASKIDASVEGKVKTRFLDWLIGVLKEWQEDKEDAE